MTSNCSKLFNKTHLVLTFCFSGHFQENYFCALVLLSRTALFTTVMSCFVQKEQFYSAHQQDRLKTPKLWLRVSGVWLTILTAG